MKAWIGRWLTVVGVLHSAFAVLIMKPVFPTILERGVIDSVGNEALIGAPVWFMLFSFPLLTTGLAISALEKSRADIPKSTGWLLLLMCAVGAALFPASGFWLAIPAGIAILVRKPARSKLSMTPA
ncbi:DUF6463 family protein [Tahibacter amnicola]|uniref:DUF6463 family protein n=1 Tax=Tahibacter amnicola TaxID=2976241 RepID=A0ABY6B9Z9_9GAMM|nr:DUF6463 family protein [Tahibacter amnicola]UXI66504.1 DUF6463 family protein [Tahibacter amnicola]